MTDSFGFFPWRLSQINRKGRFRQTSAGETYPKQVPNEEFCASKWYGIPGKICPQMPAHAGMFILFSKKCNSF